MIDSKETYHRYLKADKVALGMDNNNFGFKLKETLFPNLIWSFQKRLRKMEYYSNCHNKGMTKLYLYYLKYRFRRISVKLGFSIPINVFGPGLSIVHYGTIVINSNAKVGKNCRIHACTNIGASGGTNKAPIIGNNVYIAPGAKIYGDIEIGNNIAIGANAVVNKSFTENDTMLAGNPAKKIKNINIKRIIRHI
ncbi:serine acetyltransferase [Hyunsoonleella sp. SJ7]|uniref:Serine acetyltransferase n=1 Tax=Hyunsoonleella aquatilis TaxID=2762758 RepID=A0A923HII7_9FLAO|nr:serine acetyltransferase [Hyunsoonleella aquatilis]MBC3758987.1 serine acetyltransferase [Hyunsoonleella aquatilis]